MLATITDKKIGVALPSSSLIDYYEPDIVSAQDFYPFGMLMPKRSYSAAGSYRYGFNGKENDNDVKGLGNQQDYGMRIYDARVGRFLSVDPLTESYPWYTPYQFAGNNPIWFIDLDGLEEALPKQPPKLPQLKNPSESTCIGCYQRTVYISKVTALQRLQLLEKEYHRWKNDPENVGKPVPPQYAKFAPRSTSTQLQQGGYLGSSEHKIVKARYDTYGKYLPGISDIDDGLTFIKDIKDGNYRAAAFSALFFLPGGDLLKPLKALKGAGKIGGTACMDYAKDFMNKYKKKIEEAGGTVTKMEINIGNNGIIGTETAQLATTGKHQFIEVADASGAVKIFDNAHPDGILKDDFIKSIGGSSASTGAIGGEELYKNYAKKVNK